MAVLLLIVFLDLLLRGAGTDYQKMPSLSTNLQLRFLEPAQPMVAQIAGKIHRMHQKAEAL